ncbi:myosin light chain alkali [Tribolium castaneum]|uniref:Myosin light chain alkali n=1 Tax=Tribolium castaneum TaxID=7070 RepID=D6W9T7_TRICA|nr:PREDICTED: myosin light chain alkali [Tribolium castaneum]EEZ98545.2 Myosin light chain alkali-like Protein [Tribolium castaneum]|eukprot:XP_008201174.1 PREDICTED: myosin light chain alkali [Tribolium castaneum]
MADLKEKEIESAKLAFDIHGEGETLDGVNLNKFLYCLDVNPSLARLEKFGVTKKPGEKKFKFDELLPIYSELKKEKKDQGCYEDFIECLKLYDKNENGKMAAGELSHSLLSLGEKLTDAEVDELFEDCLDEEDDEGDIEYIPFLRRMCSLDPPIKPKKKK